jgi:hypothetical protein
MKPLPFGYYIYKVRNLENHGTVNLLTLTLKSLYFILFGTPDLHSHIRYRCVKSQIKNLKTLDVGGTGYISFSLAINGLQNITLSSYTEIKFNEAIHLKESDYRFQNIKIIKDDAESLNSFEDESFVIRAIIELEHHDVNIIRRNRYIKGMPKAVFLIMEVRS